MIPPNVRLTCFYYIYNQRKSIYWSIDVWYICR